jgi:hypothetical protein
MADRPQCGCGAQDEFDHAPGCSKATRQMVDQPYTEADVALVAEWFKQYFGASHIRTRDRVCAREILDALAAAGRLLPEGAHVEIIYGSRDRNGHVQSSGPGPIGLAHARASLHPVFVELVVQERRLWPDGTRFSSPWRTFQDQGSTDE